MSIVFLESKDNPKIKHLRGLIEQASYRKKQGQTVLEGTHLGLAWIEKKRRINSIFTTEKNLEHPDICDILDEYDGTVFVIAESLYSSISTLGTTLPFLAVVDLPSSSQSVNFEADTLILENVQDPGNVGTLLRSAAAAGIKQVICSKGSAALWSPRVLRAGMGAHFSIFTYENIALEDVLERFQIPIFATNSHDSSSIYEQDLKQPCVWILGNEGQGVSDYALAHSKSVAIPQPGGQESLNVAVAGSICFFEMARQRL